MPRLSRRGAIAAAGGASAPFDLMTSISWTHAYWTEGTRQVALGLVNNGAVATWKDEAGTLDLTQPTAGRRPLWITGDATMGRTLIRFDSSDGTSRLLIGDIVDLNQPNEIVIIGRLRSLPVSGNAFLFEGNGSGRHALYVQQSVGNLWTMYAGTTPITGSAAGTTKHLHRAIFNGSSSSLFIDESAVTMTAGDVGSNTLAGISVGAKYDATSDSAVDVCFVGVSDGGLTSQQRADLHTYAQAHYGTA